MQLAIVPSMNLDDICSSMHRERMRLIERCLVGAIEQIEGRVPTNDEVKRHGRSTICTDGSETFTWKGQKILEIPRDAVKCVDNRMVFEIKSVFKDVKEL